MITQNDLMEIDPLAGRADDLRPLFSYSKMVTMKILDIFIVLGADCKFIDAFYVIMKRF
jgi:hypothetical protein